MNEFFLELGSSILSSLYSADAFVFKSSLLNLKIKETTTEKILTNLRTSIGYTAGNIFTYELYCAKQQDLLKGDTSEERFLYFKKEFCKKESIDAIFKKYPLFKQRIHNRIDSTFRVYDQLIKRLDKDLPILQQRYFSKSDLYLLAEIEIKGDFHRGGQATSILTFHDLSGLTYKVVYKPRNLKIDICFQQLLSWFNTNSSFTFATIDILERGQYGWCQYIENKECDEEGEIAAYYFHLGQLLCLSYVFGGYDLHYENVIAHGKFPIIIDYECVLRAVLSPAKFQKPSVFDSMILPIKTFKDQTNYADFSILSGQGNVLSPIATYRYYDINKDTMYVKKESEYLPEQTTHIPRFNDQKIDPLKFEQNFMLGFSEFYHFILKNKDKITQKLDIFNDTELRLVLRSTAEYGQIQMETLHPTLLHDCGKMSEYIKRNLLLDTHIGNRKLLKSIVQSEQLELSYGDIPLFVCKANSNTFYNGRKEKMPVKLSITCLENARNILKTVINQNDLELQLKLIRNSFDSLRNNNSYPIMPPSGLFLKKDFIDNTPSSIKKLAQSYMIELDSMKIENDDLIFWPSIESHINGRYVSCFTGLDFYEGLLGIAQTYIYGGILLDYPKYVKTARKCIKVFSENVENEISNNLPYAIGAYNLIGGGLFVLNNAYTVEPTKDIADLIYVLIKSGKNILKDKGAVVDVISGSAGFLSALLTLHEDFYNTFYDELVTECINHIIEKYPSPELYTAEYARTMPKQYKYAKNAITLGYAHGLAGISVVLARANSKKENPYIIKWIHDAIQYEKSITTIYGNPNDFKNLEISWKKELNKNPLANSTWCNGIIGVGIARLELAKVLRCDLYAQDAMNVLSYIEMALSKIDEAMPRNLCHGLMGLTEFLLMCYKHKMLTEDNYNNYLIKIINKVIERDDTDRYRSNNGIMLGSSGIVYQLFRLLKPHIVPSILSFS